MFCTILCYGRFPETMNAVLGKNSRALSFWMRSLLPCRLAVHRQWASALLQAPQSGDAPADRPGAQPETTGPPSRLCPVWHLKHLRSLPCRGRSDVLDRLGLPGAGGALFPISPGQLEGGGGWGGHEIALKSSWLETLITMTVLRLTATLFPEEGSVHLAVMLSESSQDGL